MRKKHSDCNTLPFKSIIPANTEQASSNGWEHGECAGIKGKFGERLTTTAGQIYRPALPSVAKALLMNS